VGKLIAVYSPKGGVGCTSLAINLATAMCQLDREARVAIVDCSLQFGDVGILLYLRTNRSIVDLADNIDDLDTDMIETTMTTDERSGLRALLAPPKPEMAELVTVEHVRTVLERLQQLFDYIVVDMGSRLLDLELTLIDIADRIVLVIAPDLSSIKDARYFFEIMEALEYPTSKALLVLNKADPGTGISARAIENHIKHPVFAEIPDDRRVVLQSVNQGIPYILMPNVDKRSPLIEQTMQFAQRLLQSFEVVEESEEGKDEERPLGRLFR
jgi:pilus assembly protein CpaE